MSAGPLAIEIILVCGLAALLLHHYGNWRKQHLLVTLATFVAWYFSFLIIFIVPLDVSSTAYRQCLFDNAIPTPETPMFPISTTSYPTNESTTPLIVEASSSTGAPTTLAPVLFHCEEPWSHVPSYVLPTLWHIIYWTSQVLTWLVLPMMQSYANAGDFTVIGKIKSSLIENAIYYGTYLLIFTVCLIYVAARPDIQIDGAKLKVIGITASNTWGLFLLVLLLGYGLVDVPRTCWENSKRGHLLEKTQFKISKMSTEKSEAEENLEDVLDDVKRAVESIGHQHFFRAHVETILLKCPDNVQDYAKRRIQDDSNNPTETPTEKSLVRLHKRVIRALQDHHRTQCQWNMLIEKAFELQDTAQSETSIDRTYKRSFNDESIFRHLESIPYWPTIEWYWKCAVRPLALKIVAVILALFSVMVVWSECTFFSPKPVLSIFANIINLAESGYDYLTIEVMCIIIIAYLCVCAYYTIFRIRLLNYFQLVPNHQTDENSLIFSGMLLCRLTPPLCLNFLGLIHLDSHITKASNLVETSYTQIMGHMDVISFISDGFNIYFPILILLLCLATYFHVGSRVLHFIGFQQFIGDDEMTSELIEEGNELIRRERRRRERIEDGEQRRRNWHERFGDRDENAASRKPYRSAAESYRAMATTDSPAHTDRSELLRNQEPVDYNEDDAALFDLTPELDRSQLGGLYQHQDRLRQDTSSRPPKGIFDDI